MLIPPTPSNSQIKTFTLADALIERIASTYTREEARRDGIYYWPDPLPSPMVIQLPDPLILFKQEERPSDTMPVLIQRQPERIPIIPMTMREVVATRNKEQQGPSMQIPLGMIDKPEVQQRDTLLVDLHGSGGALAGGPLLIVGAQHSGKLTALQTLLLWLTTRYSPQQFRCAIIDPSQELDFFQDLPHLQAGGSSTLWTDGSTDDKIMQLVERFTRIIHKRHAEHPSVRWNNDTLAQLWKQGIEMPLLLLVISHYHHFAERPNATIALKKLALMITEARAMGMYLAVTTAEIGSRFMPGDLLGKFGTKIGLFLNEQQRYDLFGRPPVVPEPLPGRGLVLTPDRAIHQVQLALPVPGATENQRNETLKSELSWLAATE